MAIVDSGARAFGERDDSPRELRGSAIRRRLPAVAVRQAGRASGEEASAQTPDLSLEDTEQERRVVDRELAREDPPDDRLALDFFHRLRPFPPLGH